MLATVKTCYRKEPVCRKQVCILVERLFACSDLLKSDFSLDSINVYEKGSLFMLYFISKYNLYMPPSKRTFDPYKQNKFVLNFIFGSEYL